MKYKLKYKLLPFLLPILTVIVLSILFMRGNITGITGFAIAPQTFEIEIKIGFLPASSTILFSLSNKSTILNKINLTADNLAELCNLNTTYAIVENINFEGYGYYGLCKLNKIMETKL